MKLKDIVRESRETFKGDMSGVPVVGLEHLIPEEISFSEYEISSDKTFTKAFHKGQVLFGRRRAYQKKAAIAHVDGVCSGDIMVLEAIPGKMEPSLLPFIIQNNRFFDYAIQHSEGGLSPRVKWNAIANYEFSLPSIEEQKILADKLWAAYRVKESYRTLLATTDEMLKAKFNDMFGKAEKNGTIADLVDYNITSVKKAFKPEDVILYIDISSVCAESNKVLGTTEYVVKQAPSRAQQCVKKGDILVSTTRPLNRNIAVIESDAANLVASTGFCVLRAKEGYSDYVMAIVKSDEYTDAMCDKATGGVYPAVNNGDVLSYGVKIPSEKTLQEATAIIRQAEATKALLRQSIDAIDRVIRSLINQ